MIITNDQLVELLKNSRGNKIKELADNLANRDSLQDYTKDIIAYLILLREVVKEESFDYTKIAGQNIGYFIYYKDGIDPKEFIKYQLSSAVTLATGGFILVDNYITPCGFLTSADDQGLRFTRGFAKEGKPLHEYPDYVALKQQAIIQQIAKDPTFAKDPTLTETLPKGVVEKVSSYLVPKNTSQAQTK